MIKKVRGTGEPTKVQSLGQVQKAERIAAPSCGVAEVLFEEHSPRYNESVPAS